MTPDPCALPLLNHSFDVHQHRQRHTARGKAAEQKVGARVARLRPPIDRPMDRHTCHQHGTQVKALKWHMVISVLESLRLLIKYHISSYMCPT